MGGISSYFEKWKWKATKVNMKSTYTKLHQLTLLFEIDSNSKYFMSLWKVKVKSVRGAFINFFSPPNFAGGWQLKVFWKPMKKVKLKSGESEKQRKWKWKAKKTKNMKVKVKQLSRTIS